MWTPAPPKAAGQVKKEVNPMESILSALIAGAVTLIGVLIANSRSQAVTDTKLEELTREVREHNNFARRVPILEEQMKVANHRIADLEADEHEEKGPNYERTHLQRTHHLRRHHCPHRLPAAGPDQSGAQRLRQARPAHREPDRGTAGLRWYHHRGRAGRVVEEQQLHPRSPSGRPDLRQAEGTGKVYTAIQSTKII